MIYIKYNKFICKKFLGIEKSWKNLGSTNLIAVSLYDRISDIFSCFQFSCVPKLHNEYTLL